MKAFCCCLLVAPLPELCLLLAFGVLPFYAHVASEVKLLLSLVFGMVIFACFICLVY